MGLLPSILRLIIDLRTEVELPGPVITFGNQEVYGSYEDLVGMFAERGCRYAEPAVVHPHTSALFRQSMPERARNFVHARTFFEMLGISEYWDLDSFPDDSPMITHDLNLPVPENLRDRFGFVVDSGTLEHIFDTRACMRNVVDMLRVNGWVLHVNPASAFVDHGFYSFSPCLYYDFYESNGFGDSRCLIFEWNVADPWDRCPYFEYSYGMQLNGLLDPSRVAMVFYAARKRQAVPPTIPTQGFYDPERTSPVAAGAWAQPGTPPLKRSLI